MNPFKLIIAGLALAATVSANAAALVDVPWLQKNLGREDILLVDTSPAKAHAAGHIPGAVHAELYGTGIHFSSARLESALQAWGVSPGRKIVIYDEGASNMATWLFFELYYAGFPEGDMSVLDGGMAKWQASGGAVTKDPTPAPAKGTFSITTRREDSRVRMPELMVAWGDKTGNVVVDALDADYHYGDIKFFDRAGHIPNGIMWSNADFYNADKTFKSPEEIRRMAAYLGIKPEQQVNSYCGGGVAATVPFFGLRFVAGYPKVRVYKESAFEWTRDERTLPIWTYDAPYLRRDMGWVNGWNNRMMRMFGVAQLSIVDVRSADAYRQGHVPYALNVSADVFRQSLSDPSKLPAILGPAGVNSNDDVVIVSKGGLNEDSAIAFLVMEKLGHKKVALLMESVDDWGLAGLELAKEPTIVGRPKSPQEMAVPPASFKASLRDGVMLKDARGGGGLYPKVWIVSGKKAPEKMPDGKVVQVPYTDFLDAKGAPKPANEIWKVLAKAGIPRYAEIVLVADDPGEAAINYYIFRLMGFPDVKVLVS
jgi:thiosulfate/3-mercaptopyruvate sulfurtransferase